MPWPSRPAPLAKPRCLQKSRKKPTFPIAHEGDTRYTVGNARILSISTFKSSAYEYIRGMDLRQSRA
ncbi:MAG: hypothetical protein RLZZ537_1161 [Pseudomonadota bacterium]